MNTITHRTWAEVDLSQIEQNFHYIEQYTKTAVLCIIKANAYGHGSIPVAQRLQTAGAAYFGVATVHEAVELRLHGITIPILILGYVDEADTHLLAKYDITATVYDIETAQVLSRAAMQEGKPIAVHFKLDTGMTRLGFSAQHTQEAVEQILTCAHMQGLLPTGIFTHFASSDQMNKTDITMAQVQAFDKICACLENKGLSLAIRHCANSGAIVQYPSTYLNMVRAGILLYGYYPDDALPRPMPLAPALQLKAHVVQVRKAEAGSAVSYGGTYTCQQAKRIAVLSIGYADGYLRAGSQKAQVCIKGRLVPIVGTICMDMCMAELPDDLEVERGEIVTIYGTKQATAEQAAEAAGTIVYEVLCAISSRVPRIYIDYVAGERSDAT